MAAIGPFLEKSWAPPLTFVTFAILGILTLLAIVQMDRNPGGGHADPRR